MTFPTIENFVGTTPLVRLQRLCGDTSNTILVKLEGNNPAGSVKDRPALSMIQQAEARGDIVPGDTLIEATSGNTGIALAMVAAIKGYGMILIMPENLSVERRASMRAYGAKLILVTAEEGMEARVILPIKWSGRAKERSSINFQIPIILMPTTKLQGRKFGGRLKAESPILSVPWGLPAPLWEPLAT